MRKKSRGRKGGGGGGGGGGVGLALILVAGGALAYALVKRGAGGGAGLSGSFSVVGRNPVGVAGEYAGVSGVKIGTTTYQSADITFNGSITNGGNADLIAPNLYLSLVIGTVVHRTDISLPGNVAKGQTIAVGALVRALGADPIGVFSAKAQVVKDGIELAVLNSAQLGEITPEALVTLTGSFGATGR